MSRLSDQTCLVLGGGSGIGHAVACAYLDEGARVVVVEREAELAAAAFEGRGRLPRMIVGDATDPDVIAEGIEAAGVDGVVDNVTCCVGGFDHYASLRSLGREEVRRLAEEVWRLNVLSVVEAAAVSWPHLSRSRGSLTLTLSESAFHPVGGGSLYGSAKWALRGLVAHLAADFAPEVRVNGVAPGGTSGTSFGSRPGVALAETADRDRRIAASTLMGLTPAPSDHAGAYVYLADRVAARIVTGVIINTDGGRAFPSRTRDGA